jgi:hypothetical protein
LQKVANRRSIETKLAAAEGGDKRKGGGDQLWKGDGEAEQMGDFSLHLGTFVKRKPRKDHGYTDEGENLLTGGELAVGEFSGDEKGVSKTRIATQSPWLREASIYIVRSPVVSSFVAGYLAAASFHPQQLRCHR